VKAGLALDGWMWPLSEAEGNVTQPLALLNAEQNKVQLHPDAMTNDKIKIKIMKRLGNCGNNLYVKHALHHDFHDFCTLMPVMRWLDAIGSIPKTTMIDLINQVSRQFFDQTLKLGRTKIQLQELCKQFPELQLYKE